MKTCSQPQILKHPCDGSQDHYAYFIMPAMHILQRTIKITPEMRKTQERI